MDLQIVVPTANLKMTPYVLALGSSDLRRAAENLVISERFPVTNFLLHAMSIEIGLKAAILNQDCSAEMKGRIKDEIRHDLLKAHQMYQNIFQDTLFDEADLNALEKLNRYFKRKDLEYFTAEMLVAMLTAFKEFPRLDEIRRCNCKVEAMLGASNHFL
jgi:hypothetical protein